MGPSAERAVSLGSWPLVVRVRQARQPSDCPVRLSGMVRILIGLCAAAVIAAGGGWWVSTHSDAPARFQACHVDRGEITLDYLAGAGDDVAVSVDPQPDAFVVALQLHSPSGVQPAVGQFAQFTYHPFGAMRPLRYADGTPLRCS